MNTLDGTGGANRTISLAPALGQYGTSLVTITASDGLQSTTSTFVLTVNPVNQAPTISTIAAQSTDENTATGAIPLTIGDVGSLSGLVVITATSSNATLLPSANLVVGGNSTHPTLTATPAQNQSGESIVTVTVSDGALTSTSTFELTVNPRPTQDQRSSVPYPLSQSMKTRPTNTTGFTVGDGDSDLDGLEITASSSDADAGGMTTVFSIRTAAEPIARWSSLRQRIRPVRQRLR